MTPVHTGGCQCGAVRYALYSEPYGAGLCHCRMCQKAVGGPVAAYTSVRVGDFAWTRGEAATFRSSSAATRGFCTKCGTPLTFRYDARDEIDVTIGSLDRPGDVPPVKHVGTESRLPWMFGMVLGGLPARETEAGDGTVLEGAVSFQHPDHDTPTGWRPPKG
jgi:hypothetical protein